MFTLICHNTVKVGISVGGSRVGYVILRISMVIMSVRGQNLGKTQAQYANPIDPQRGGRRRRPPLFWSFDWHIGPGFFRGFAPHPMVIMTMDIRNMT